MGVTSYMHVPCMHVPYGDICHFGTMEAFLLATNSGHQMFSLWFSVGCTLLKRSTCCSARDSSVVTVGAFVEVIHAEMRMV